ncbi:MAG TPA: hypothetical protein VHJ20_10170 [Polyangia bacterium]|nr:hypothetical protein [Polyangia bacterium]
MTRAAGAFALAALSACATVHRPEPSPRISVVVRGGLSYFKDGHETPVGPLGGDLEPLVADDAEAVRYARRARHELAFGVPAYLCGIAGVVVGLATSKPAGWYVAGAGAAVGVTGIGFMGAGAVNLVDAVNVYNDDVTAPAH